jgi:hypothetical protein
VQFKSTSFSMPLSSLTLQTLFAEIQYARRRSSMRRKNIRGRGRKRQKRRSVQTRDYIMVAAQTHATNSPFDAAGK